MRRFGLFQANPRSEMEHINPANFRSSMSSSPAPRSMPASGGEVYSALAMECGYGANSGPSRADPCRRAYRPIEAPKSTGCYVRITSTPAVCGAIMRRCRCRRAADRPGNRVGLPVLYGGSEMDSNQRYLSPYCLTRSRSFRSARHRQPWRLRV